MLFQAETYFNNLTDKQSILDIHDYNSFFKEGILICHRIFYYFILGSYDENLNEVLSKEEIDFGLNEDERLNYLAIQRLLESIKIKIGHYPTLYITPHIFTKFVHLLREKIVKNNNFENKHYKNILKLLQEEFGYIKEEPVLKDEIIEKEYFNKRLFGLSETTILILKDKKTNPCILSLSGKIFAEYKEDFLLINFSEVLFFVKEEKRRQGLL